MSDDKIPEEMLESLRRASHELPMVPRPWGTPPTMINFPPAPFSQEWWDALSPAERQQTQEQMVLVMGRLTTAMQSVVPVLRQIADVAMPLITQAFGQFAKAIEGWDLQGLRAYESGHLFALEMRAREDGFKAYMGNVTDARFDRFSRYHKPGDLDDR